MFNFNTRSFITALALGASLFITHPAFAQEASMPRLPETGVQAPVITDIVATWEKWENSGIRFVVRNENGQFVTWGFGKLESWDGHRTVVVVRNTHGQILTWVRGQIETGQNGETRYTFRDKKTGRFLMWAPIELTNAATFAQNLERLVCCDAQSTKHYALVVEVVTEAIIFEMKKQRSQTLANRFCAFGMAHATIASVRPKLLPVVTTVLDYLKHSVLTSPSPDGTTLCTAYADLEKMLR